METRDKDQIIHYYNREKRLERASANAMFAIDRHHYRRPGIIKSLTATRSLSFLFFSLLFMIVAAFLVNYIQGSRNSGTIDGNRFEVEAVWFEGYIYATIVRSSVRRNAQPIGVDLLLSAGGDVQEGFLQASDSEYRVRVPADAKPAWLAVIMSSESGRIELAAKVR
ncbi:MAG: hypothetical protein AB7T74_06365 [Clostridia bacterium]|jgi:hypothetical protein|nr:hypothetical protein [Spirochaetia bacterium]